MRNTWKGLVVGGLTGIAGGAVLDIVDRASRRARRIGESAKDHVPEAASWLGTRIAGAATDAAKEASHTVKDVAHVTAEAVAKNS